MKTDVKREDQRKATHKNSKQPEGKTKFKQGNNDEKAGSKGRGESICKRRGEQTDAA